MLNWQDREYVNARKKVFKNLDTDEILNLELQDDPDNILQDSNTPLTAHNLNLAQQELINDISKTYTGTNITADTVAGYGRINKLYGNTVEEGTGEKSPDNPYTLKCVGDDVNLFDMKWLTTRVLPSTEQAITEIIPFTFEAGTYTVSNKLDNGRQLNASYMSIIFRNSAGENIFTKTVNGTFEITEEQAKSVTGINLYYNAQGHVGKTIVEMKLQKGSVATPYTPYGCGNVEVISTDGTNTSSNVVVAKPLCSIGDTRDEIDYTKRKITRRLEYTILTENNNYSLLTATETWSQFRVNGISVKNGEVISNKFNYRVSDEVYANKTQNITTRDNRIRISFVNGPKTIEELKTWLYSNPFEVIYEPATPITEDIDCSDKIVQYANSTNIYNRDGAEIEISLTNNEAIGGINKNINDIEEKQDINIVTGQEFKTNKIIDGKRVYGKRINFGTLPNATNKAIAHNLENVKFVDIRGIASNSNGTVLLLPHTSTSSGSIEISANNTYVTITTLTDRSGYTAYVTLDYIKD